MMNLHGCCCFDDVIVNLHVLLSHLRMFCLDESRGLNRESARLQMSSLLYLHFSLKKADDDNSVST